MTLFVVLMAKLTEMRVWRNALLSEVVLKWSAKEFVHVVEIQIHASIVEKIILIFRIKLLCLLSNPYFIYSIFLNFTLYS